MLVNTSVFQILLVFVCCGAQFRMISTSVPIELRSYGPFRYFDAWVGYSMYQLLQTSAFTSGMSIIITFYLKYEAVRTIDLSWWRISKFIFLFHIPILVSVAMEIIMVLTQSLPEEVQEKYKLLNSNVIEYSTIGALSLKTLPSIINFSLISGSVVLSPFISFFFRQKILARIGSQFDKSSALKKTQNRFFVKGLTIQAFLPLVFYVPIFGLYFYCITTHAELLFQQYFMTVVPALPAFFDPLVTLYFVTPYRKRVKIWMRMDKRPSVVAIVTSQLQ